MRVGIFSLAHFHGWSYGSAIQQIPGCSIAVVWDDDEGLGRSAAAHFGCPFEPDLERALAMGLDAAIVTAENAKHAAIAIAALRRSIHVLCEKPIATSIVDGEAMIAAAREAGVQLMTAFPVRYAPPVQRVKRALEEGAVGEILVIRGTNHGRMAGGWFADPVLAGGGAVMDHTVHVADLIRWMTGREFTSVYAEIDTRFHDLAVDDCAIITMEMEGGIFCTLDPSWSRTAAYPTWGDVTLEIVGTRGTISLDVFSQNVALYNGEDRAARWVGWGSDMDQGLLEGFVDAVRTGRPVPVTGEDGLRAMEVALLAYESARRGEPVERPAD